MRLRTIFLHKDTKFVCIPDSLAFMFFTIGGSNSVRLTERLASLYIMISEEHCQTDEILFQNIHVLTQGICKLKHTRNTHYILCLRLSASMSKENVIML